jgi:hypothetical protein
MFAVDIAAFGDRDPDIQLYLRGALYRIVQDSCAAAGISWIACHHEDRGDGILVVAPGTGETVLLDSLIAHLRTGIRTHNKAARPAANIRLRMAVNAGYVIRDAHGVSGKAVIQLFRMINAPTLKTMFADRGWIWLPPHPAQVVSAEAPAHDHIRLRPRTSRARGRPGSPHGLSP